MAKRPFSRTGWLLIILFVSAMICLCGIVEVCFSIPKMMEMGNVP